MELEDRRHRNPNFRSLGNAQMAKQVFVTYAQENKKRKGEVLAFAERLRRQGLDAQLDQYEVHPSEGWPHWQDR